MIDQVHDLYSVIEVKIDVKDEARVHLWYESHNGYSINPYTSLEEYDNKVEK